MRASASIPPYREAKEPISSSTVYYILYIHTYIEIHILVQMDTKYLTYVEYIIYTHTFTQHRLFIFQDEVGSKTGEESINFFSDIFGLGQLGVSSTAQV